MVNKKIDGQQCTISWHVDDLKISHQDANIVTPVIKSLNKKYGTVMHLYVSRGKVHDYLRMNFDFSNSGRVTITMYDQVNNTIDEASDIYKTETGCAIASPTNLYSFREPRKGNKLLSDAEREEDHTLTTRCLYVSKCGRPDIQTYIMFHCKRVYKPILDHQKKLGNTIRYFKETIFLPLILSIDKHGIIEWWIDASFVVHEDTKGRPGMCMSFGIGTIYAASVKQNLNTVSTTEYKLVGVADDMPKMVWT